MPTAYYFGCWDRAGHYFHDKHGRRDHWLGKGIDGFPECWRDLMDGGLLTNGRVPDHYDGRVFWTCGGRSLDDDLWFAFYWWDNSVDRRGACNSGFYVHGFKHTEPEAAFEFACKTFPNVVARQRFPLTLQLKLSAKAAE